MSSRGQALVIHPGPLGDVLLAIPALRALRKRHGPGLVLAAQTKVGELLHVLGVVDACIRFELLGLDRLFVESEDVDRGAPQLNRDAADRVGGMRGEVGARHEGPDGGGGASRLSRDAADRLGGMGGHLGAPHVIVCWFGSKDPTFVRRLTALVPGAIVAPPWRPDVPVWEHLLTTIGEAPSGADREPVGLPGRLALEGRIALEATGWDGETPLMIVHPGASGSGKRWPADGYAEVIAAARAKAHLAVVLHEGPSDREPVRALLPRIARPVGVLDNPPLTTLAAALGHAHVYLGNDSGVSHLAATIGARSLVLITARMQAWEPWSRRASTALVSTSDLFPADVETVTAALLAAVA